MLNRRSAELDPSLDHLEETAGEELQAGFLEGPFQSFSDMTAGVWCEDLCLYRAVR